VGEEENVYMMYASNSPSRARGEESWTAHS